MPPKQRFTHEIILEKAYEMFLEGGMTTVNARSVSKALNCSTQPIFSYFPDMAGLRAALIEKGYAEFSDAMKSEASMSVLERSESYVCFAVKHARVFRYLLSLSEPERDPMTLLMNVPDSLVKEEAEKVGLSEKEYRCVLKRFNTYVQGVAFLASEHKVAEDELSNELQSVYNTLIHKN